MRQQLKLLHLQLLLEDHDETPGGRDSRGAGRGAPGAGGDRRGGPRREPRAKPEYDQKIIDIRRVTRVASGGRRFSLQYL